MLPKNRSSLYIMEYMTVCGLLCFVVFFCLLFKWGIKIV